MDEKPASSRAIMFLIFGAGIVTTARAMSMTFVAIELQQTFGLGPATIGFMLGIGPLLGAAAAPFAGSLSDRVGRKPLLTLTLMAMAVAMNAIGLAQTLLVFCLAPTLAAVAIAVYGPLSRALLSDICPAALRLKHFSWRYTASNVGWTVGPILGVAAGLAPTTLFIAAGITYAALALILHFLDLPVLRHCQLHRSPTTLPLLASIEIAISDSRMGYFVAGATLLVAVYGQWSATLAPYLSANIIGGVEIFAYLVSINGAVVLLGNPFARRFIERAGALCALVAGCLLFGASQIGFAFSTDMTGFAISMIVFTIGEILVVPSEFVLIDRISNDTNRGAYYGAHALSSAGSFLGPTLGGMTLATLGAPAMFTLFAGFSAASALLYVAGIGRPPPNASERGSDRESKEGDVVARLAI